MLTKCKMISLTKRPTEERWFDMIFITFVWHTGIPGLWTQELDAELWTLDDGLWTLDDGPWMLHLEN